MRRLMAFLLAVAALLAIGGGCGKDCSSACSKIYDECNQYIKTVGGGQASKQECVDGCNSMTSEAKNAFVNCVHSAPCDVSAMGKCVTGG